MAPRTLVAFTWLLATASAAGAVEITHGPVHCVVADRFPQLTARFSPADGVARARVHFRPQGGAHWYSVPLRAECDAFAAVLLRPRASLAALQYYIDVTGRDLQESRTEEYQATIASGPGACADKKVAGAVASAAVSLEAPAGAPAIPAGFSSAGVTTTTAGATA